MRFASITDRLADLGSGKWKIHIRGRALAAQGVEVIELTIGEPDIPPDPALIEVCAQAMRDGRTRYSNGQGEAALLDALSAKYSRRCGRAVGPENLLYFPGTQTALFTVILGLVERGGRVLVPDPSYATYEGVVRASGAEMAAVPLWDHKDFRLQPEDLEAAITPDCRVLLLNSPHNPTGAVLSAEEIAAIGAVCREHDLWIVSDEVYEDLIFDGVFASPLDDPGLAERTVAVSSISKSHAAPGFRSGWAVGPAAVREKLLPLSETMLFGGQPFIADMTVHALTHDFPTARLMREAYRRRARLACKTLTAGRAVPPKMPAAGMFMLIDIRATGLSGTAFADALLDEERVAVMPGESFGERAAGFIRLSLTVPDESLAEACRRIGALAERLAHAVTPA